ncbi:MULTISPECIES: LysR family transcriptional regulator [unclassified Pseudodesulfovibrio]|uniref:LysR family transcriptional regulator n=1 Tax=unclassified Pseudodesulfovibrio TaxID=2661612 RepID=UPI000FEC1195|nr:MULTISPECIES: LysR family transcriptional regulator [unclassified Pseudodesulfovibrio]MCJ2165142.1 LysR family transcriptional regulator [Pseudodesulfovibrio sp. S3-i]RWU03456.1 LysR family transcriptional regulator [Pseudodesulfovibrio sp. S3]
MELYQLRTFVAVAEEGNITRAGKRVHATQPAVSAHIKALEEELGVRLFDRVPRGVELTQAGAELVEDAIKVLTAANMLQARAVTLGGEVAGHVGLGLCSDPAFLKTVSLITRLSEQFPKLNLKLVQSPSGVILSEIRARNLDAGFIFSGNPYRDLEDVKLAEPTYSIMGAAKWENDLALADARALSAYTWIMPTSHCPFRELQLSIFNEYGIVPSRTIGADSEDVIRPLIIEGKALALVREDEVAELLQAGQAAECALVGRYPVELNFVYRKGDEQNPSMAALIEIVRRTWGV